MLSVVQKVVFPLLYFNAARQGFVFVDIGCYPLSQESVLLGLLERVTERWWLSHVNRIVDTELSWYFP